MRLTRRLGDDDQGLYKYEVSGLRPLCLHGGYALRALPMGPEGSTAEQRRGRGRPSSYEGWRAGTGAQVWNARHQVGVQAAPSETQVREVLSSRMRILF